jgi:hypothetical protein
MPRRLVRFCLWAWIGAAALAQQAPSDPAIIVGNLEKQTGPLAETWLHSPDPRFQAWGAYLVLRDRHTEAIPDLLALVAGFQVVENAATVVDADQHDAMLGVLDTLIQFGAPVPVADAQRLYPEFPVQSLILLSRSQEDTTPALLAIFQIEQRWPAAWLAAGNMLLQRRAAGFGAAVVARMTVHAQVVVLDPNAGWGGGGSSHCCGPGPLREAKVGWPPLGAYEFAGCGDSLQPGATVLAAGIDPAYYERQATDSYQVVLSSCGCYVDRDLVRQHYLSTLLRELPEPASLPAHVSQTLYWHGPETYLSDLAAFVGVEQRQFADVARRLAGFGMLSDAEAATLRTRLQIHVLDARFSRDTPLPALAPLPENVTVEP